jgi:CDP-paratose 2-epimerase
LSVVTRFLIRALARHLRMIEGLHGAAPDIRHADERPGDQRWYVSDISRLQDAVGWEPRVDVKTGVASLYHRLAADGSLAAAAAGGRR